MLKTNSRRGSFRYAETGAAYVRVSLAECSASFAGAIVPPGVRQLSAFAAAPSSHGFPRVNQGGIRTDSLHRFAILHHAPQARGDRLSSIPAWPDPDKFH